MARHGQSRLCIRSSVDRASASGAEGREFESRRVHLVIGDNAVCCWPDGYMETPPSAIDPVAETRQCPHCGGSLKAAALVCRHCHRDPNNPHATPMVGQHDWERETPVETVTYTARLPVSERQWTATCYALSGLVAVFWLMLALQAPQTAPPSQARLAVLNAKAYQPAPSRGSFEDGHSTLPKAKSENHKSLTIDPTPTPQPTPQAPSPLLSPGDDAPATPAPPAADADTSTNIFNRINAPDLAGAYDENTLMAEDHFTHKQVTVSGRVVSKGKTSDKTPFVVLRGRGDCNVKCLFTAQKGGPAPDVAFGSDTRVVGTCDGRFLDVMISDCNFEP